MSLFLHATRIVGSLSPEIRQAIGQNPLTGVRLLDLTASPVEELEHRRGEGGWCDGVSFLEEGVILYCPSPYSRRQNFTIVHEIAHWLVDSDDDALDWVADHEDSQRVIEQLCDHIAGKLLIADEIVSAVLDGQPVHAAHLRALYDATAASEPACAIALARRLPGVGAIVIIDRATNEVAYSSLRWDGFDERPVAYPWSGQRVPETHPLTRLAAGDERRVRSWWSTPWGERHPYYMDVICGHNRIHAIFCEQDLWAIEDLHLDVPDRRTQRPSRELTCPCGFRGTVTGYPHDVCGEMFCPKCDSCGCTRKTAKHRRCSKCTVLTPPADLIDELCSMCR
ncbi:uncharacterized protein DUF955 [Lentzea atacamensis]|uniref:Uncharacterized protein DUF955 n=1 Tax=Lentzea atacamensis TaxID=531938 RepID=A0A316HX98_9PSEU|nr:ImmA/IrrE family metallo-endopeptidase [Lentzea atacamensis]PWK84590.1 uncharacterized protein DUF955 [Lentzea atacamensis]